MEMGQRSFLGEKRYKNLGYIYFFLLTGPTVEAAECIAVMQQLGSLGDCIPINHWEFGNKKQLGNIFLV